MDSKTVTEISKQVYRQFPEMKGVEPKVRLRKVSSASQVSAKSPTAQTFLITFQANALAGSGITIPRWVRVVADAKGKIIKISTSR